MNKCVFIVAMLFIIGCNTSKKIQIVELSNNVIEVNFIKYSDKKVSLYLNKKIKLRNPYFSSAKVKLNYFVQGEQIDDIYAYALDYDRYGNLSFIGSDKGEVWGEIKISPLGEREIIYERYIPIEPFEFVGIYKSLEQYIPLAKHPIRKSDLTGETYEDTIVLVYKELLSEFKRKNPELVETLTKGDTIELEILSPEKEKYRYNAEW
ncbi:hypothetical protein ACSQ7D_05350 [Capnocytophaga sp. G1920]|uniref:hypothetical protein n=1 Tax=Capnocytophaga sp. G1920 TaxID=3448875 RepID=UPI003EDBE984